MIQARALMRADLITMACLGYEDQAHPQVVMTGKVVCVKDSCGKIDCSTTLSYINVLRILFGRLDLGTITPRNLCCRLNVIGLLVFVY